MDFGTHDFMIDISPAVFFGIVAILLFIMWIRKRNFSYLLCLFIFSVYLFVAIQKTLFPIFSEESFIEARKNLPLLIGVNLVPFYFGHSRHMNGIILGVFQNILLTMPLGFGLSFVLPAKTKNIVWLLIAGGLGFEMAQLLICLAIGYTYRVIVSSQNLVVRQANRTNPA